MAKDADKGTWKEFMWNPRTRELMGRTASSWGLILLFYLVFYIFLAGMFALTMYVMLQTLDEHKPTWQDRLATPGMMIRPKGVEALEIVYSRKDTESWDKYLGPLNTFLEPYNDTTQAEKNDLCVPNQLNFQSDMDEVKNNPKRSCQFNRSLLEECSGLTDPHYGYKQGMPCVFIKLNRVIGLIPGDGVAPYVKCGAKKEDTDKIGEIVYFPPNGTFNLMYYPYYGKKAQVNYSQPLVAVKFLNITTNEDVNIECKIVSNSIPEGSDRDKFAGRVSFKLRIDP